MGSIPYPASHFTGASMPFEPGSILMVTVKEPICFVRVKRNLGALPGVGWLLFTEEGNHVIVSGSDVNKKTGVLERIIFVTDPQTYLDLYKKLT